MTEWAGFGSLAILFERFAFSGEPNGLQASFLSGGDRRGQMFCHDKADAVKPSGEIAGWSRGGNGQQAACLECVVGLGQPAAVIHPRPVALIEGRRVEMNEDGVEAIGIGGESGGAGIRHQGNAGVRVERAARQMAAVPLWQLSQGLGDNDGAALLREGGSHAGEEVAQPESDDEYLRLAGGFERCAGEAGQLCLDRLGGGTRDLLALDKQVMLAIVFLENQQGAVGEFGTSERNPGFHGANGREARRPRAAAARENPGGGPGFSLG